jgi:hypothetical protein
MTERSTSGLSWAGLAAGPAAWVLNTQVNYPLPAWTCARQFNPLPLFALGFVVVALIGGWLSWRAWRRPAGRTRGSRFVAGFSAGLAVLFALVILMQGSAALIFTGCERGAAIS